MIQATPWRSQRASPFSTYLLAALAVFAGVPAGLNGQGSDSLTSERVQASIQRAVVHLQRAQAADGRWPDQKNFEGGLTPLATLALLHAGCSVDEPEVKLALSQLRKTVYQNTYAISLQTLVFCRVDPVSHKAFIARNALMLTERQVTDGKFAGMWSQPSNRSLDHIDNSMTHFAMLALYEAEKAGVEVDQSVWRLALDYWERAQNPDGSWGWGPGSPGSGSMTCAGIAALAIASNQLNFADASIEGNQINCCGQQATRSSEARALSWLEHHFLISRNPGWNFWHSYYLYSLERAGRLTGRRFFGKHDWYREGAAHLVRTQGRDGSWVNDLDADYSAEDLVSTAFSLMFLAKAQRPIVIAQLQHLPKDDWNRHRRGVMNLVGHVESMWKQELTHQFVDVRAASVDDLMESPILFIQGKDAPQFTSEDKAKLRGYVERGGFIFAEQCCQGGFDAEFRKLMQEIFPEADAQLQRLPSEHIVWFAEHPVKPTSGRELWGITFGCRTCVIYSPQDLSCYWELDRAGREQQLPAAVLPSIQEARWIGANVLAYATNRQLRFRSPTPMGIARAQAESGSRGQLQIARVIHGGDPVPAARAMKHILEIANEDFGLPPGGDVPEIRLSDPGLFRYPLIVFSGRTEFRLSAEEREQLRLYLTRGGKVLADAIASSPDFSKAFRRELKNVLPSHSLTKIPTSDPIYGDDFGGSKITLVNRRQVNKSGDGPVKSTFAKGPPVLEGVLINGRYGVIFSPIDISCTVESTVLSTFDSYDRSDAIRVAVNALCYLIQN